MNERVQEWADQVVGGPYHVSETSNLLLRESIILQARTLLAMERLIEMLAHHQPPTFTTFSGCFEGPLPTIWDDD